MSESTSYDSQCESEHLTDDADFLSGLEDILAEARDNDENEVLALRAAAW